MRNLRELAFEVICGAQRVGTQGVRCLEHEQRLVPFGKHAFEFGSGARHRIVGNDQAVNGRIGRQSQGTVDTRCGQEHEGTDDPEPRAQHAEENLMHEQGSHSIKGCAHRRLGYRRAGMIA